MNWKRVRKRQREGKRRSMICALLPNESQVPSPSAEFQGRSQTGFTQLLTSSHAWNFSLLLLLLLLLSLPSSLSLSLFLSLSSPSLSRSPRDTWVYTRSLTHFSLSLSLFLSLTDLSISLALSLARQPEALNPIERQTKIKHMPDWEKMQDWIKCRAVNSKTQLLKLFSLSLSSQLLILFSLFLVCVSLFFPFCDSTFILHQCWIVKCGRSTAAAVVVADVAVAVAGAAVVLCCCCCSSSLPSFLPLFHRQYSVLRTEDWVVSSQ